jgi:anti-anti-sigma factor
MSLAWTTEDPQPNVVLFELHGRLTCGDELQQLKKALEARARDAGVVLVLDLSGVEHADSSGIGVLLYLDGSARTAGSKLRLAGATRRLLDLLRLTHTDKILTLDADVDISLSLYPR